VKCCWRFQAILSSRRNNKTRGVAALPGGDMYRKSRFLNRLPLGALPENIYLHSQ
jgi:hypothetical protein